MLSISMQVTECVVVFPHFVNSLISTFKLCDPEPGQYQMKLKNQHYSVVRNMSLCISGEWS